MRLIGAALFLLVATLVELPAENSDAPLASQILPIGTANVGELRAAVQQVLTPKGKLIILPSGNKIYIQDTPDNLPFVVAVVQAMTAPKPNVRLEITANQVGDQTNGGITIRGNQSIHVEPYRHNELDISGGNQNGSSDSLNTQMLLVQSGSSASMEIVHELVVAEYFRVWLQSNKLADYVPADFHWEKIGSYIQIKPTVSGQYITVQLTPVLTSLQGGSIVIKALSSTVTVMNGSTTQIGAFDRATADFNSHFFGYGASSSTSTGTFTLKATIEPVPTTP